jgi:phosphoserine phosphatase
VPLEDVYGKRLDILKPNSNDLSALGRLYVQHVIPDARQVCTELRARGQDVRIISGGLLPAVTVLAQHLGIPESKVAAVGIFFDDNGNYRGYDRRSPLTRSGGKLAVLQRWLRDIERPVMMVGDGSTDMETAPVVDLFVAFAGIAARSAVTAAADFVIESRSLADIATLATPHKR